MFIYFNIIQIIIINRGNVLVVLCYESAKSRMCVIHFVMKVIGSTRFMATYYRGVALRRTCSIYYTYIIGNISIKATNSQR